MTQTGWALNSYHHSCSTVSCNTHIFGVVRAGHKHIEKQAITTTTTTKDNQEKPGHGLTQTKPAPNDGRLSRGKKPKFMRRQSGNAGSYSLLLMSESTTRRDGWASCSRYCLKASSSLPPPAVALCLRWEARRLWWLMHSPRGSQTKNLEFLCKCFLPIGDSLTQYLQSGASRENKIESSKHQIFRCLTFLADSSESIRLWLQGEKGKNYFVWYSSGLTPRWNKEKTLQGWYKDLFIPLFVNLSACSRHTILNVLF